jgi:type IV pilus assembly protein PilE
MNKNKGFTLIELIVVIAIIGVLTTIVLVVVSSVKSRSNDNAIKASLNQVRTQADIFYTSTNTYTGVCLATNDTANPKGIYSMVLAAARLKGLTAITVNGTGTTTTATCNTSANAWAAEVPLVGSSNMYCVDSTRKGVVSATSIGAGVACN